jgi:hypothetical protein
MESTTKQRTETGGTRARSVDGRFRLLVIAPAEVDGGLLREEVEKRLGDSPGQVHVVSPAVAGTRMRHILGDIDEAAQRARVRLDAAVGELEESPIRVSGRIGDGDPIVAAQDALAIFPADEILIVTHPHEEADWFEDGLFDRAAERLEPPITHAVVPHGARAELSETESAGEGTIESAEAADEVDLSENLPPFSRHDLAGIGVAIVGTVVLAVLAASSSPTTFEGAARILIAMGVALINLAHVVGLVFFDSVRYRGGGRTLFQTLSLYGTPAAVAVSLLIGLPG